MVPANHNQERRQFYRIEDRIGLETAPYRGELSPDSLFGDPVTAELHHELQRIDQEVRLQIATLAETDRNLAFLLKGLNNKLDTLARIMAFERKPLQPEQWVDVTLSEGGLAFLDRDNRFSPGDRLALRITLCPELARITTAATVQHTTPEAEGHRVHLQFDELEDGDRQQLARHVLRCQARQRQEALEAVEEQDAGKPCTGRDTEL